MLTENPKPGTKINICGIPKKQDDIYYCPYCNFESDDIEDFATSMCWDCAFSEDETKEDVLDTSSIKVGDTIRVTKHFDQLAEVMSVGDRGFYDTKGSYYLNSVDASNKNNGFDFSLVKHKEPDHFPPQTGDVWLGDDSKEYFITASLVTGSIYAAPAEGPEINISYFKPRAVKLLHRKGDKV